MDDQGEKKMEFGVGSRQSVRGAKRIGRAVQETGYCGVVRVLDS